MGVLALLAATACQGDPRLSAAADSLPAVPLVRLVVENGGRVVTTSNLKPGEAAPAAAPRPSPTVPPKPTATVQPTRTATAVPTKKASPIAAATAVVTPRTEPDLAAVAAALRNIPRYRARVTGPFEYVQEVDGARMRIVVSKPFEADVILEGKDAYARVGASWVRVPKPRPELTESLAQHVHALAAWTPKLARVGGVKARAGRCQEWEIVDGGPTDARRICISNRNLPYRLKMPGGGTIELYDFGDVVVPEPSPKVA